MKKHHTIALALAAAVALLAGWLFMPKKSYDSPMTSSFTIASPDLREGQTMPLAMVYDGYGCTGSNVSPELKWEGAPSGTRSFALTMYDPDAPMEEGWMHWLVLDIPADVSALAPLAGHEDDSGLPKGAYSVANSYGKRGYGGPCPPVGHGPHRYIFTIYAMPGEKTVYPLNVIGKSTTLWLQKNALASASFTVLYERK